MGETGPGFRGVAGASLALLLISGNQRESAIFLSPLLLSSAANQWKSARISVPDLGNSRGSVGRPFLVQLVIRMANFQTHPSVCLPSPASRLARL